MTGPGESRRIFWMVQLLAAVGLSTIIVLIWVVGRQIKVIRTERLKLQEVQEELHRNADEIIRLSTNARSEIITLLDVNEPARNFSSSESLARLANHLLNTSDHRYPLDLLKRLDVQVGRLTQFAQQVIAWRGEYDTVWQDLGEERTAGQARDIVISLRGAVETLEGQQRLREAVQFKRWRAASGGEAALLGRALLAAQVRKQNHGTDNLERDLAEIDSLVESLAGEERPDDLPDLKDNKLKPALERLRQDVDQFLEAEPDTRTLSSEPIEKLTTVLFGRGYSTDDNEAHQTIRTGANGLYSLRRDILLLRTQRSKLDKDRYALSHETDVVVRDFIQLAQTQTESLAAQVETDLASSWRRMLVTGVRLFRSLLLAGLVNLESDPGAGWHHSKGKVGRRVGPGEHPTADARPAEASARP